MNPDDGFRELGRQECLDRLGDAPVGRVVHTRDALPAVLPVNFCLDAESAVVLRTSADSDLARSIDGSAIAGWAERPTDEGVRRPARYRPALVEVTPNDKYRQCRTFRAA
jgi:hypothetical protein